MYKEIMEQAAIMENEELNLRESASMESTILLDNYNSAMLEFIEEK